ncbi:MAG: hypothetical protein ACKOBY_03120 [Cyanobium sp.]
MSAAPTSESPAAGIHRYPMAPLIRFTLLALYLALVLPLPFLAPQPLRLPLALALPLGLLLVVAATSERVELDGEGLRVGHPRWCSWLLPRGWSLPWAGVRGLTPVATSQGGRVWYVRSAGGEGRAYLLPQRVARFDDFLARFAAASGVDTSGVGRISPAWTYQLLAVLSAALLVAETIGLALVPQLSAG